MKSNYRIGDLVERVDIRNTNGDVDLLLGVSIEKCFIRSVANTIGTDLSKYKVIRKDEFAVSLMQVSRDSRIPIACLKEYDEAIMSPCKKSSKTYQNSPQSVPVVFATNCTTQPKMDFLWVRR